MVEKIKKVLERVLNDRMLNIYFQVYIVVLMMSNSTLKYIGVFDIILHVIRYYLYFIFFLNIVKNFILKKYTKNTIIIFWFILSLLILLHSQDKQAIILLVVTLSLYGQNKRKFLQNAHYSLLTCFIIIILASLIGLLPDWIYFRGDGTIRHSLGFHYATIPMTYFFSILLLRLYNKKTKIKFQEILVYSIFAFLLFSYTDSKTGFLLSLVVIIMMVAIKYIKFTKFKFKINLATKTKKIVKKWSSFLVVLLPIFLAILSIVSCLLYKNNVDFIKKLDEWLSGRIYYSSIALDENSIPMFGKKIEWFGWGGYGYIIEKDSFEYNFVDNSYLNILFNQGVIFLIFICILFGYLLYYCIKENEYYLLCCVVVMLLWALLEPNLIFYDYNAYLIYLAILFEGEMSVKRIKKNGVNV